MTGPSSGSPSPDELATSELEAFFRAEDPVRLAAVTWHTRKEQGLSHAEEAELQQWLAAQPAHRAAFARIDDSLLDLRALPRAQAAAQPAQAPVHTRRQRRQAGSWLDALRLPRAASLALACAVLVVIGVGAMQWLRQPTFTQSFVAERGQRLDVPLPDGTQLALDAETRLEVTLFRDRREVRLMQGQAMFVVAHDASKPFVVLAGPTRVSVVGTRFAVRYQTSGAHSGEVDVNVEQGHVRVADATSEQTPGSAPRATIDLLAGQALHASASGQFGDVSAIDPASVAPWRKGLVHFSSTPLAEAIEEFERYGPSRMVIRDPAVAALRIGGSYQIGNPGAFAAVLPQIIPVRLVRADDGDIEIVRKN